MDLLHGRIQRQLTEDIRPGSSSRSRQQHNPPLPMLCRTMCGVSRGNFWCGSARVTACLVLECQVHEKKLKVLEDSGRQKLSKHVEIDSEAVAREALLWTTNAVT